jgi:protein SMG6
MTTLHPFTTSRESVLPIWSAALQARRALPDAHVSDLFVLLHGMLFTNIQLDDFAPTLARFIERLEIEGAEETQWIMMGIINIGGVLEYGRASGTLKKASGGGGGSGIKVISKRMEEEVQRMEIDNDPPGNNYESIMKLPSTSSPALSAASSAAGGHEDYPAPFKLALQLTFAMLSHVLRFPTRKANPFARTSVNPYLTIVLTFLVTMCKQDKMLAILERSIPWDEFTKFLSGVPRSVMMSQGLNPTDGNDATQGERWAMLTSGVAPPLDEDWCLRGMEWVGRKVYERGFWKSGEERRAEIEVLDRIEGGEVTDGIIEDEDEEDNNSSKNRGTGGETIRRWTRIVRCSVGIASVVDGFRWVQGTREWVVEGQLKEKVVRWKEEERREQEEDERRRMGTRWDDGDAMEVDDDDGMGGESEESGEDELDSEEVKALKARRRYLRTLLHPVAQPVPASPPKYRPRHRGRKPATANPPLNIVPGYTVLIIDTNILLSSLSMFASLVESLCWTVLVPLPVIMELEGLSSNASQLGDAATSAMSYISSHIKSHSTSLKVQTSKGNYLPTLNVRSEQVDFSGGEGDWDRNMDDLILKAAIWQDEHWVDRSALLNVSVTEHRDMTGIAKVVLMSLDRNCEFLFQCKDLWLILSSSVRLKARSRQLPVASERDLAYILAAGT